MSQSIIQSIANYLVIQTIRSPWKTTLALPIIIGFGVIGAKDIEKKIQEEVNSKLLKNSNYSEQIKTLNATRKNLDSLIYFVDNQKKQLETSQVALESVKTEHEKLKPLLESDRKVLDAIFAVQESRSKLAQSTERWIGFGLGVLASLIASIVWAVVAIVWRKRKTVLTI